MVRSAPASYVIWKDETIIRAKCLVKGGTDYSGPDASTVIQAAINALTSGGLIFFKRGDYYLNATLLVDGIHDLWLSGEGVSATHLRLNDNKNVDMIKILNSANFKISNMWLDGNKANQTSGNGIFITSTTAGYFYDTYDFQNMVVSSCKGHGIYTLFVASMIVNRIRLNHAAIAGCDGDGINLWGNYEIFIDTSTISQNGINGIYFRGAGEGEITTCNIFANGQTGIRLYDCAMLTVEGNFICTNGMHGIIVSGTSQNIIVDANLLYNNSEDLADTYSGIALTDTAQNNVITNNNCWDSRAGGSKKQAYGIVETATADYNLIAGNNCIGNSVGAISNVGTHTTIYGNMGYNPVGNIATPYSVAAGYLMDVAGAQAFPSSATDYTVSGSPKLVTIYGGTVTSISVDGVATGLTSGAFQLNPGQILNVVWTVQPSSSVYAQ